MPEILSSGWMEYMIQLLGLMFPEKIQFDGEKYQTNSYNKVLEWIFQNTNELGKEKPEERDDNSYSSGSAPPTGRFYEPFMRDLELIWKGGPTLTHLISANKYIFM